MNICIAGQHEIAVRGLDLALARLGRTRVVACPSRRDQGGAQWQPSLRRCAETRGVRTVTLDEASRIPDLLFLSLQFDTIINPDRFREPRLYNLHFSLLPAYRGLYTTAWSLLNGERESGVTLHQIDHGIDTGDIVAQRSFPILSCWNSRDLYLGCMQEAITLLEAQFDRLLDGRPPARPQSAHGATYYGRKSIDYGRLRINLEATADQVARQVRAFHFREFQIPTVHGMPVGVPEVTDTRSKRKPGSLVDFDEDTMLIATIDYDIKLLRDRSMEFFDFVERSDADAILNYAHGYEFIDVTDSYGLTPLMRACHKGRIRVCEALVQRGADPGFVNANGVDAFACARQVAELSGDSRIFDLLSSRIAGCG